MKNEAKAYPRVLIINRQSIYADNATGITLRKLWSQWPKNCVMEICANAECNINTSDAPINRFALPQRPIDKLLHSGVSKTVNKNIKTQQAATTNHAALSVKQKFRQFCTCIPRWIPLKVNKELWQKIETFKPDVIYTLGGSVSVLQLVHRMAHRLNIGVVMHFMDNWIQHNQWENNKWLTPYYTSLKKWAFRCMTHSRNAITISPSMAAVYEELLHVPCDVLMNMVDIDDEQCPTAQHRNEQIRFVYAGGLHLDRWQALKQLAQSIQKHCSTGILQIYTSDANKKLYEHHFAGLPVTFMPMVHHDQISSVLKSASILVHTEVASPVLEGFFKHSISTKVPEYMASGRPFLFYAPRSLGVYQYLEENRAAILADTEVKLDAVIAEISKKTDYKEEIANAWRLAKQNHSSQQGWERLYRAMVTGSSKY